MADELPISRANARLLGKTAYFSGKPCPKGHLAPRQTSNGNCHVCKRLRQSNETNKNWKLENVAKIKEYGARYRFKNRALLSKRELLRRRHNIDHRLASNLRSRLNCALRNGAKAGSAIADLGCSVAQFKTYMEALFHDGMTWANWSPKGWHIDHVKPLRSFDLSDHEQFKRACHFTNLQPLWALDNLQKRDKTGH